MPKKSGGKSARKRTGARKQKTNVAVSLRGKRVQVQLPVDATAQDREEAAAVVETLDRNAQIAHGGSLPPGATHQIEKDSKGNDILVRKRFSAL